MTTFTHASKRVTLAPGELFRTNPQDDTYRDTPAIELRVIIDRVNSGVPWREAVASAYAEAHPWLCDIVTSPQRDLFFRQHPPADGARILDIGAGWGQAALPLARRAQVVALEPTAERMDFIRAAAVQEKVDQSICFVQADFFDVDFETKFDLICCIGVLEWVPKFRAGDPVGLQREFLQRIRRLLNPGGRLVVGIENRLGLKYLLGAADDHIGVGGVAVYDFELARQKWRDKNGAELRSLTHSRSELGQLLTESGFNSNRFFGAYPDYKLPQVILPLGPAINAWLKDGEFVQEHDGSCGRPLPFQAELASHYRSLAALDIAENFAPSFFVEASV